MAYFSPPVQYKRNLHLHWPPQEPHAGVRHRERGVQLELEEASCDRARHEAAWIPDWTSACPSPGRAIPEWGWGPRAPDSVGDLTDAGSAQYHEDFWIPDVVSPTRRGCSDPVPAWAVDRNMGICCTYFGFLRGCLSGMCSGRTFFSIGCYRAHGWWSYWTTFFHWLCSDPSWWGNFQHLLCFTWCGSFYRWELTEIIFPSPILVIFPQWLNPVLLMLQG